MSGSPEWKVYDASKTYQAACKEPEAAAALAAFYGAGATIRSGHNLTVWLEGSEAFPAGESYDECAATLRQRKVEAARKAYDKRHGAGAAARLLAARS